MTNKTKRPLVPVARPYNSYNKYVKPGIWAITLVVAVTLPIALLPAFLVAALFYFATGIVNRDSFASYILLSTRNDCDVKSGAIGLGVLAYLLIANTGYLIRTGFPPQAIYPAELYNIFYTLAIAVTVIDIIALGITYLRVKKNK